MIEVELKFRADDLTGVRERVKELGGKQKKTIQQVDTYFAHPTRDFSKSDEALRIRIVGDQACVTYKGPLLDRETKSREETEIWFVGGADEGTRFAAVLQSLDFRDVHTVRKQREIWTLNFQDHDAEIAFDCVDDLGDFVELETGATKATFDQAKSALLALAKELGLQNSERRSYLALLLAQRES